MFKKLYQKYQLANEVVTAGGWIIYALGIIGFTVASVIAWATTTWEWYWQTFSWAGVAAAFLVAWLILSSGFALLARGYLWLKGAENQPDNSETVNNATDSDLAQVTWSQGFVDHQVSKPWQVTARIEFLRYASSAGCYARWGTMGYYLSGEKYLEWSDQTQLMATQDIHEGKTEKFLIAEVEPDTKVFRILGDETGGEQNNENRICCEIVISSTDTTQRERRYYGLPARDRFMPVLIDESQFDNARDA